MSENYSVFTLGCWSSVWINEFTLFSFPSGWANTWCVVSITALLCLSLIYATVRKKFSTLILRTNFKALLILFKINILLLLLSGWQFRCKWCVLNGCSPNHISFPLALYLYLLLPSFLCQYCLVSSSQSVMIIIEYFTVNYIF